MPRRLLWRSRSWRAIALTGWIVTGNGRTQCLRLVLRRREAASKDRSAHTNPSTQWNILREPASQAPQDEVAGQPDDAQRNRAAGCWRRRRPRRLPCGNGGRRTRHARRRRLFLFVSRAQAGRAPRSIARVATRPRRARKADDPPRRPGEALSLYAMFAFRRWYAFAAAGSVLMLALELFPIALRGGARFRWRDAIAAAALAALTLLALLSPVLIDSPS